MQVNHLRLDLQGKLLILQEQVQVHLLLSRLRVEITEFTVVALEKCCIKRDKI